MTNEHEAWLKLTIEDVIEPDLPICDAHHHLFDRPAERYLLEELLQDTGGGHKIVQTVFIECGAMFRKDGPEQMQPVGETEFMNGLALQNMSGQDVKTDVMAGIIGFADLALGSAIAPVLEAHIAASPERFRGIRNVSARDDSPEVIMYRNPPKGLLTDPKFREGFSYLQKYNLSFDAWMYHPQLMELVDLVRVFPDTPIILNHIGGLLNMGPYASKQDDVLREWQRRMAMLATYPNVFLKLGGLGMLIFGFGWHDRTAPPGSAEVAETIAPYFNWCIEQFGPERCMFESNFPVDKMSYSYTVLWNAFKRYSKNFSPGERAALFHDTAARFYRLTTNSKK